jgi:hypothetical protein
MTQALPANPSPRLYSQTDHDDRGNFHYDGDLYRPGDSLPALGHRIERHLHDLVAGARFAVRGESYAGGRKVRVELLDAPADLTDETARRAFTVMVRDQIERFGFTRSNFYQDYMHCSFHSDVHIGNAYWSALAARHGKTNSVEPLISLAAFKRRLKAGDQLKLVAAPAGHRALGTRRIVKAVRSGDLIFEGDVYLAFPRAAGFACDGRLVRIATGNEHEPDRHLLYEWQPAAL